MSERSFLIANHPSTAAVVATGSAGVRTCADFVTDVGKLTHALRARVSMPTGANQISGATECLVLCEDRYHFAVSVAAAWESGLIVAAPPHFESKTLADLIASDAVRVVLTDSDRIGSSAKEHRVEALLAASNADARPRALSRIDGATRVAALYTSGTTGTQKRVEKTAAQLLGEASDAARFFGVVPGEIVLSTTTAHHIYGMLFGMLVPLIGGATFVRETPFHAESVRETARKYRATVLVSVPAHLTGIAALEAAARETAARETAAPEARDASTLRRIFSSAARLRSNVRERLVETLGAEIVELLGSTETGGFAWRSSQRGASDEWHALPGVRISATGEGLLELCSPYAEGGPSERQLSADRIELVRDGVFRHLGRQDGIVKVGGKRVALQHIEEETLSIPGVRDAAAIAVDKGGLRGSEIWLAVVAPGHDATSIRRELGTRFDAVAVPRRIRCVERLPRQDNGKLARSDLLDLFSSAVSGPPA